MSTNPGAESWNDAGLSGLPLAEPVEAPAEPEEYLPPEPRPDLEDQAEEADVAEQAVQVPGDDDDYR